MVDSNNTGVGYCIQRPEEETVMLLKNDEQRLPNSNKCHGNQINGKECVTFDKHRNNCDSLRWKNVTNGDEDVGVNNNNHIKNGIQTYRKPADDDLFDDEDPYAELQSYLEKVKVSIS